MILIHLRKAFVNTVKQKILLKKLARCRFPSTNVYGCFGFRVNSCPCISLFVKKLVLFFTCSVTSFDLHESSAHEVRFDFTA